ncbi:MAG: hypothetical protein QXU40_00955 [Candidatus Pacearchaeota archaeon]
MRFKNFLPYLLPIISLIFLGVYLFVFNKEGLVGFAVFEPRAVGYIEVSSLGQLPENCVFLVDFYNNSSKVNSINMDYNEFLSKSHIRKEGIETIYRVDFKDIIKKNLNFSEIHLNVVCGGKLVTNSKAII